VKGQANGWPGEQWLDIRRLDILGPIMTARLDLVSPRDSTGSNRTMSTGYLNTTGFPLSYQDQLTYNRWLAESAHARRLSIGLKNDLERVTDLVTAFDWALNEQCVQ
jgi:hypothetical protein